MMKVSFKLPAAFLSAIFVFLPAQVSEALSVDEVQEIAQEITVRIPEKTVSGKEANGSGFLIAKEGNTYTVLTANHVVCKDQENICRQPRQELKVITHDDQAYSIDFSSVKKLPGVDLAILNFTSTKNYNLATLGDYNHEQVNKLTYRSANGQVFQSDGQFVFASGWPGINGRDITKLAYRFSVGKLLPQNKMVGFKIRPIEYGYSAVYTSITFPGMSGGPVLDTNGRVIAIHGQNEGEKTKEESSGKNIPIPIGYSLSIPVKEFLNLAPKAGIQLNVNVDKNLPTALIEDQVDEIGAKYLLSWYEDKNLPNKNSAAYWAYEGNQHWRALNMKPAIDAYNKALELDPEFYPVMYGKGLIDTFDYQYDEAIINYDKALKVIEQKISQNPNNIDDLQKVRGWVENLRQKTQILAGNSSGNTVASPPPASVTSPPSTIPNNPPASNQDTPPLW
jgi:tetratricopeptide (TPR) repeat protein